MLVPNKMQHVICTGNVGSKEQYDELRGLAPNVHVVSGDAEYYNANGGTITSEEASMDHQLSFPDTRVVQVGDFR